MIINYGAHIPTRRTSPTSPLLRRRNGHSTHGTRPRQRRVWHALESRVRKFTLIKANYLREQLRLYAQVSDPAAAVSLKVSALGPMVSFSQPEQQVARTSRLHVLWQAGARTFNYCIVNPDGTIARQETYDNFKGRPHLKVDETGEVTVRGGTRRTKSSAVPPVSAPSELPAVPATS